MLTVAAFYRFTPFDAPGSLRAPLLAVARDGGVRGTILLAPEGVNGTIAGPREGVDAVLAHLKALPGCADLSWKESPASEMPFARMKVRVKREIVTLGRPEANPSHAVGTYVPAREWNDLISRDDVVVIDTRNDYEVSIGTFRGAVDPGTRNFGEFPDWWAKNGDELRDRKIAMFCTGGIRCEKASSYLLSQGVEEVFHLDGGILKYLEEVPESDSLWDGACFVFDGRVSVAHGLAEGDHSLCHACGVPLTPAETLHPHYEAGVSCPRCMDAYDDADRARFRERQRQVMLAQTRGLRHMGSDGP